MRGKKKNGDWETVNNLWFLPFLSDQVLRG